MRVVTVTVNAAVDTTYRLDTFTRGGINRVTRKTISPGGKGNNVARVLALFGHSVMTTGFVAGVNGALIEQALQSTPNIATGFMRIPGESRVCLTLLEQASGTTSELLEPGVEVPDLDAARFLAHVGELAIDADVVVLSGSLPRGLPPNYYAQILTTLRPLPARLVLDSSGAPLRLGLAGRPHLVKPNIEEMATLMGCGGDVDDMVQFGQQQLIGVVLDSAACILLSLGARGAVLIKADRALIAQPPPVQVINAVGAGDAMLAGFLDAEARLWDDRTKLVYAVATGTAAALQELGGVIDTTDIARLAEQVQIRTM